MEHLLWVEKYRPKTIEDCILPDALKETFQEFVKRKEIPNLLLSGTAGVGKTTVAKALCNEDKTHIVRLELKFVLGSWDESIDEL